MEAEEQGAKEEVQSGGIEGYTGTEKFSMLGGKRRRTKKGNKMKKGHKGTRKGIRKGKRPPSRWIMHVKAFSKKRGMKYPDALKSKDCRNAYKKH